MDPLTLGLIAGGSAVSAIGQMAGSYSENEWRKRDLRESQRQFDTTHKENVRQFDDTLGENKRQYDGTLKFNYERFYEDKRQFKESHKLNQRVQTLEENKFGASESQRRIENAGFFNMIGRQ